MTTASPKMQLNKFLTSLKRCQIEYRYGNFFSHDFKQLSRNYFIFYIYYCSFKVIRLTTKIHKFNNDVMMVPASKKHSGIIY